ncbi:HUWE1 [Lepeophtheirus salmonis]|uniref:HUWE1 n=1 Tax=Lepeophtheirus salmonis TaxID=72036 RepID=A0A7R8D858_LEPSM|nr:HUWE1 [Lepeophtheirus salmonis]CAF3031239.1 HUWE1 [Lepeophtheirus salmonis]
MRTKKKKKKEREKSKRKGENKEHTPLILISVEEEEEEIRDPKENYIKIRHLIKWKCEKGTVGSSDDAAFARMKIDRSKLKKSSSEVPSDCKALIDRLRSTSGDDESFLRELKGIETWTYGKCELLHWIDVLDLADRVLESACSASGWTLKVDGSGSLKELVLWTLHFTTLLIEHSFSRHLYSSMEHLTALLASSDLDVVLAVLNLLYMFSKRSNFITRLSPEKRGGLLTRLNHLAASWGGKDNGFGLKACCTEAALSTFPPTATTLHFEFYADKNTLNKKNITVIHLENVDTHPSTPGKIMEELLETYPVPEEKRMLLFTYLRLAHSFSNYAKRLKCVQARLQALSVLIYSNQLSDNVQSLLYSGLLEELVEVLEMKGDHLMEIKAAALKSLTSIIHLDRNPNFPKLNTIIDVTGASSYHASYEAGGEALVSCGMMESLLKVIQWPSTELDHITFVTRAVRVIDLITNLDMQSFQTHSGLSSFIVRLELEVEHCREQQPFEIHVGSARQDAMAVDEEFLMDTSDGPTMPLESTNSSTTSITNPPDYSAAKTGLTCLPQRAALLKSMLNFLKKATDVVTAYVFQEPSLLSSLQDKGLTDVVLHALLVKDVPATREVLGSLPNVFSALCLNNRGLDAFVACKPFERLFKVLLSPVLFNCHAKEEEFRSYGYGFKSRKCCGRTNATPAFT